MCSMLQNIMKLSCYLGGPLLAKILHISILWYFEYNDNIIT